MRLQHLRKGFVMKWILFKMNAVKDGPPNVEVHTDSSVAQKHLEDSPTPAVLYEISPTLFLTKISEKGIEEFDEPLEAESAE